ncbi:Spo0E family sporulation regulatory protein-aspartic acid phosphatase [Bacillota bacterium Lsc_1132]
MKVFNKLEILLLQIESKRNEMVLSAVKTGLSSEQTISKSRELDDLLNLHQQVSAKKKSI